MQNQAKKQQFDKNCSAVSPKLLSSLVSSFTKLLSSLGRSSAVSPNCWAVWWNCWRFSQTAQQFGETADQTAEQFGGNCWAVWPNCWAVWWKLLSSFVKLLAKLLMILVNFVFFALSKFIFDTKNHMVIKRNMVQSCSLWSPLRNIPFEGFLKNKYINEPFLGIRKTYIREPADQTTCFQRPWQFCALLFSNKLLQYFASPIYLSNSQPPICLQYASNMFPSWPSFSMLFWPAMWACS